VAEDYPRLLSIQHNIVNIVCNRQLFKRYSDVDEVKQTTNKKQPVYAVKYDALALVKAEFK